MKPGDPIDLDALAREGDPDSAETVTVQRTWLAQVHRELMDGRVAQAQLDIILGSKREPGACTAAASHL